MKFKKIAAVILSLAMIPTVNLFAITASAAGTTVVLDPSEESPFNSGEFQGWGTSLCWWANRVGYSEELTAAAAEAFFSDDGLSLDIARYNIGGGDDPEHDHITRSDSKVPGVWESYEYTNDGADVEITYDINNDENQLNVAKAALKANPDLYFEGFSNSAPYFMTNSGCTSGAETASEDNLDSDMYDDFAEYIADATALFADEGIVFKSYSPMNEPDTSYWGANSAKQEGCHFSPGDSQSNMITALRTALNAKGLTDVLVAGMDETSIDSTVTNYAKLTEEAQTALGRIDTHTYSGSNRSGLKALAEEEDKDLWMSEVDGGWDGFGLAERIILDMNGMMPSAWVMWDIVDSHKDSSFQTPDGTYSEKNTTLDVTGTLWGVGMADHDTETLYLANKYYAFGQFTKYIEPGDTIIASSDSTLAAYNKTTGDIKIVALNSSSSDVKYTFDLSAFTSVGDTVQEIRSNNLTGDSAEHWAEIEGEATLEDKKISTTLKAGTVTTYIVKGKGATDYAAITGGDRQITLGSSVNLSVKSNFEYSSIVWSSSDERIATVTQDGTVTALKSGTVTIYATVDDFTTSRGFEIPNYVLTGTASWSSSSSAPADSADFTKVADENFSTYFDGTTGGWVQYDYGERYKVSEIKLAARSGDSTYTARTVGGTVQGSNDAITWTDLYKITTAIPADEYTTISADELVNQIPYRYYRYTNTENMANIAEFLIEGEPSTDAPAEVTKFEATSTELSYAYEVSDDAESDETADYHEFFAIYDSDKNLKYVTIDESEKTISGDFTDADFKLFVWKGKQEPSIAAVSMIEPKVTDLSDFTDNFEGNTNIFDAESGLITDGGNVVFASDLDRYGNVFAPVKSTATATLSESVTLTSKDKFRLTFTMFAGWENNGKENDFVLNDADGNELVALKITGGGYNFNEIRIGGEDVLGTATVAQCRSNPGTSKAGANGWNASGQPYVNNVGYNKTVEITIDGAGNVTVSATGGMADTEVTGTLTGTVTLGSMVLTGDYNSAAERTVSYDNFDGDIITYADDF